LLEYQGVVQNKTPILFLTTLNSTIISNIQWHFWLNSLSQSLSHTFALNNRSKYCPLYISLPY
jgi:hypothetical protein